MAQPNSEHRNRLAPLVAVSLGLIILIVLMVASVFSDGPQGQSLGLSGFIGLWFRELLLLGGAVLVLAFWVVAKARRNRNE